MLNLDSLRGNLSDIILQQYQQEIMKAAQTLATNTFSPASRSVFAPENLDPVIKLMVPISVPLRDRLPRKTGYGQAASWKKLTSKLNSKVIQGQTGTGTSIAFADAAAPGETTQTYSVANAAYKLLGRKLDVGGLAIAATKGVAGGGYANLMDAQLPVKINEVKLGEEELIICGDSSFATTEFDGLLKSITTTSGSGTLLTVSGIQSQFASIFDLGGQPTCVVLHRFQANAMSNEIQNAGAVNRIVFDNQGRAIGGLRVGQIVNQIDGTLVDIVVSRFIGDSALILSEKSPAGENWIEMEDLIPLSRIDVPSTVFSYTSFVLEASVLKLIGEVFQAKLCGLATN